MDGSEEEDRRGLGRRGKDACGGVGWDDMRVGMELFAASKKAMEEVVLCMCVGGIDR